MVSGGVQWLESRSIIRSHSTQMRSMVLHPSVVIGSDPGLPREMVRHLRRSMVKYNQAQGARTTQLGGQEEPIE
jgi:hypothetical protein